MLISKKVVTTGTLETVFKVTPELSRFALEPLNALGLTNSQLLALQESLPVDKCYEEFVVQRDGAAFTYFFPSSSGLINYLLGKVAKNILSCNIFSDLNRLNRIVNNSMFAEAYSRRVQDLEQSAPLFFWARRLSWQEYAEAFWKEPDQGKLILFFAAVRGLAQIPVEQIIQHLIKSRRGEHDLAIFDHIKGWLSLHTLQNIFFNTRNLRLARVIRDRHYIPALSNNVAAEYIINTSENTVLLDWIIRTGRRLSPEIKAKAALKQLQLFIAEYRRAEEAEKPFSIMPRSMINYQGEVLDLKYVLDNNFINKELIDVLINNRDLPLIYPYEIQLALHPLCTPEQVAFLLTEIFCIIPKETLVEDPDSDEKDELIARGEYHDSYLGLPEIREVLAKLDPNFSNRTRELLPKEIRDLL